MITLVVLNLFLCYFIINEIIMTCHDLALASENYSMAYQLQHEGINNIFDHVKQFPAKEV